MKTALTRLTAIDAPSAIWHFRRASRKELEGMDMPVAFLDRLTA
jgi:hypothetical protein